MGSHNLAEDRALRRKRGLQCYEIAEFCSHFIHT